MRTLTGSDLKIIGCISMLIDHAGIILVDPTYHGVLYSVMRSIGRIAFPIFCFLIVEGFTHTRDKRLYLSRLIVFAFLSEIPFNLGMCDCAFAPQVQNVFFTLALGLAAIIFIDIKDSMMKKTIFIFFYLSAANWLHTDYQSFGVFLIMLLYLFKNHRFLQVLSGMIVCAWEVTAPFAFLPIYLYNGKRGVPMKYFFYFFYPSHLMILWIISRLI